MLSSLVPVVLLSLYVSGAALAIAAVIGVPAGARLALYPLPGHRVVDLLIYTGLGLPPGVVGLAVYLLLSRSGPLGGLSWLFTPAAMITAQTIIALPLVVGLTQSAVEGVDSAVRLQVRSLGATAVQTAQTILWEARSGVVVAVVAGFGRIIAEVGAVMLVGGNIQGSTRVLTTAIVLETRQGNFGLALALGGVLLALALAANALLLRLGRRAWR